MTIITAQNTWSAPITFAAQTLVCVTAYGPISVALEVPVDADDGFPMNTGQIVVFAAGQTVRFRSLGTQNAIIYTGPFL
jgi:hypothetical protein